MSVRLVVPREEALVEAAGVLLRCEAVRKLRHVLERLELGFAERVVVRAVGPRLRLGDAQVGEEECHGLGGHRGAAVSVNGQLVVVEYHTID